MARDIVWGLAVSRDIAAEEVLDLSRDPRLSGFRHRAWAILRAEENEDGSRRYSDGQIGSWWGVTARAVAAGAKRLDQRNRAAG